MVDSSKVEARVRALLARAEHPTTPVPEAEAAAAKAAELMLRHALDEAKLRLSAGKAPDPVDLLEFEVNGGGGYGGARADALAEVVLAYGAKCAIRGAEGSSAPRTLLIVGTQADLRALRLLLPSLSLQMESAADRATRDYAAGLRAEWPEMTDGDRRSYRKRFRRGFLRGYGRGVAEKIARLRGDIAAEIAGTGTALVVIRDDERIEQDFRRRFPDIGTQRREAYLVEGSWAGRVAGRRADIGQSNAIAPTS